MGHVINPTSWRLSHIKIWKNSFGLYDTANYPSLSITTYNIVKILEILCKRRIVRGNLFFFGGLKYLSSSNKSFLLFSFKSRFYYMFALSNSLFNVVKKKILPFYTRNVKLFSNKRFLNLVYLKRRFYFRNKFYYNSSWRAATNYLRFYWLAKKYYKSKRPNLIHNSLFRFINYYKLVGMRRRLHQELFIFFKSFGGSKHINNAKGGRRVHLLNLYLNHLIKKKKKSKFKSNLTKKLFNVRSKKTKYYSVIYIVRKFFSYKRFCRIFNINRAYLKNKVEVNANTLWFKFNIKYRLWRLFFELPLIFKFKLFFIKFLSRHFSLFSKFMLFFFLGRGVSYVDASLMRDFLLIKIKQKFKVAQLYKASAGYLGKLLRLGIIRGFKVFLAGRFSRKDRATFVWHKLGRLPLNNTVAHIDYSAGAVAVRYSTCATKVWIYL